MRATFNYTKFPVEDLPTKPASFGELEPHFMPVFSGKSAIALVLEYYRSKKILRTKMDHVLVPSWLGSWVYMTMLHSCFPTTSNSGSVKGVMVYHQWGFPQKMEQILELCKRNDLFCIEDCAHSLESSYQGQRVGTFGDVSIWSLSKFFPSVVGGGVYSRSTDMEQFVTNALNKSDPQIEEEAFNVRARFDVEQSARNSVELERSYAIYPRLRKCPSYSLQVVAKEISSGALQKRRDHFQTLQGALWDQRHAALLEECEVTPWVVPLFLGSANATVASALADMGIESGVYHFDVNRTMLEPNFQECVVVPCHQGMSDTEIRDIVDVVKKTI